MSINRTIPSEKKFYKFEDEIEHKRDKYLTKLTSSLK